MEGDDFDALSVLLPLRVRNKVSSFRFSASPTRHFFINHTHEREREREDARNGAGGGAQSDETRK